MQTFYYICNRKRKTTRKIEEEEFSKELKKIIKDKEKLIEEQRNFNDHLNYQLAKKNTCIIKISRYEWENDEPGYYL